MDNYFQSLKTKYRNFDPKVKELPIIFSKYVYFRETKLNFSSLIKNKVLR